MSGRDGSHAAALLALLEHPDPSEALTALCEASVVRLELRGLAVSAFIGDEPLGVVASAGSGVAELERQWSGIEGPATDAHRSGLAVAAPDLATAAPWRSYAVEAVQRGILAVFAIPLRRGSAGYGALVLGKGSPGTPDAGEWADAELSSQIATSLLLAAQARAGAGEDVGNFGELAETRVVVYQAAGMVSVQMGVGVAEAQVVLRTRAWVLGQTLIEVSRSVVSRQLRFSPADIVDPTA